VFHPYPKRRGQTLRCHTVDSRNRVQPLDLHFKSAQAPLDFCFSFSTVRVQSDGRLLGTGRWRDTFGRKCVQLALRIYKSFGADLWKGTWKKGQSAVLFCILAIVVSTAYALTLSRWKS